MVVGMVTKHEVRIQSPYEHVVLGREKMWIPMAQAPAQKTWNKMKSSKTTNKKKLGDKSNSLDDNISSNKELHSPPTILRNWSW
jgi:hypothetical protein